MLIISSVVEPSPKDSEPELYFEWSDLFSPIVLRPVKLYFLLEVCLPII